MTVFNFIGIDCEYILTERWLLRLKFEYKSPTTFSLITNYQ